MESIEDRYKDVSKIIGTLLSPAMEADGGGVELHSVDNSGIVRVRFRGACLVCPSINLTIKHGLERTLKEHLPWVTSVERVM